MAAEVAADHAEHVLHRPVAEERQPLRLRRVEEAPAELVGQRRADLLHVLARVGLGREDHGPAERLLVAEVDRAGQGLHLGAVVVDVVLAGHVVAGPAEQALHPVAGDGVAAVADVHGAGGVGRDVLDDDLLPLPDRGPAVAGAGRHRPLQRPQPEVRVEPQVDEARPGHLERGEVARGRPRRAAPRRWRPPARAAAGPARLASTMAALRAKSPCFGSRGAVDGEADLAGRPLPLGGAAGQRGADQLDDAFTDHEAPGHTGWRAGLQGPAAREPARKNGRIPPRR